MVATQALRRLRKEYMKINKCPVPNIIAKPLDTNILEWYYVIEGPKDSPYENGTYMGKLVFPKEYPYKPPSIYMITRNGRFTVNTRLCLSMSDFHPESWNPLWSVSSILSGLLSFMLEEEQTYGSIKTSRETKKQFALRSWEFNRKDRMFMTLFAEYVEKVEEAQRKKESMTTPTVEGVPSASSSSSVSAASSQQTPPPSKPTAAIGPTDQIDKIVIAIVVLLSALFLMYL